MKKRCISTLVFPILLCGPFLRAQGPRARHILEIFSPNGQIKLDNPVVGFQDKGGQVFNVKAYGAKGNGTTDDTAAINAADAAAGTVQGEVFFPPGAYLITSTINISYAVRWRGAFAASNSNGGSRPLGGVVIKAGSALNPMINIGHSNVQLANLRIDANAKAIEGIRTQTSGDEPRAYNVVLNNVAIQNFPLSDSSVVALDLGDYGNVTNQYACADCVMRNVQIVSGPGFAVGKKSAGIGVYISREENMFFSPKIGGWTTNVLFGGGAFGQGGDNAFFGGSIADSRSADLSTTNAATNFNNSFYNVWFEGSAGPIIGNIPRGRYFNQQFNFYSCHFETNSNVALMDLTNMTGIVYTNGSMFDTGNSGLIKTTRAAAFVMDNDSFTSSLTFIGGNYQLMSPAYYGSVTLGASPVKAGTCGDQTSVPILRGVNGTISVNQNTFANGGLILVHYTDSKSRIVFKYCNYTRTSQSPGSNTIHWKLTP